MRAVIINRLPHYKKTPIPTHFPDSALLAASVFGWLDERLAKSFNRKADLSRRSKL